MTKERFNDLLCKIRNGNKDAFVILYNEFYPKMLYTAECITNNREYACDAVQDAFVKFWKYVVDSNRPYIDYPNAYLYTITRKCAIDIIQTNAKYRLCEKEKSVGSDNFYVDEELIKLDVTVAIKKMKEPNRTVAIQFFLFDMKIKEIANIIEEPMGTVKWRISEIKKYFKKVLK